MNARLSNTIDLLRLLSCVMVVLIHSSNAYTDLNFFSYFLTRQLPVGAVPIFFFISGFLIAYKTDVLPSKNSVVLYFLRRITEIIVAYLVWTCIFYLLFYWGCAFSFIGSGFYCEKIFSDLTSILGLSERYPLVYQFWFLRDLLIYHFIYLCSFWFVKGKWRVLAFLILITCLLLQLGMHAQNHEFASIFIVNFISYFIGVFFCKDLGVDASFSHAKIKAVNALIIYCLFVFFVFFIMVDEGGKVGFILILSVLAFIASAIALSFFVKNEVVRWVLKPAVWVYVVHALIVALLVKILAVVIPYQTLIIACSFILALCVSFGSYFLLPKSIIRYLSILIEMRFAFNNKHGR